MKHKIYRLLKFIKVIDLHDGQISLTSVALLVVTVKLAFAQSASLADTGALLIALASYQGKKFIPLKSQEPSADIKALQESLASVVTKITEVESKASLAAVAMGFKGMGK